LTVTTSYQRYANDGTCNTTPTLSGGTWTVNVDAQFTSGSIKTDGETICNGQTPTKTIGSATDASGGDGTITYSWEISTDGGNNYTPISGANGSSYLPTQSITTTTLYRRLANDGTCNTTPTLSGGTWTVNVSPSTLITGDLSTTPYNICSSPVGTAPTLSVVASGSGTLTYQWYSNSTGTVDLIHDTKISTSSTFSPDISQAGTKYYYVVVSGNCGNATSSVAQVVVKPLPATPSAIIAIQSSPICAGTSGVGYSVANDPTLTYNWTYSGTGYSINGNGGSSITIDFGAGATGGTLSVTSTLNNGCGVSAASTLPITISGIPTTANAGPDQTAPCGQTSVTLAANSPIVGTGHWTSDGGSFTDANSPTSTFTGSYGVTYHLTWTISNSPCNTSSDDVAITFEAPITFTATKGSHNGADVSCSTSADGSIVVSAQGGSGNFQYSKDNGVNFQTSNEFDNLAATTYKIIVKDDKGCVSAEQDVTLVAPKSITVSTNAGSILCNGNAAVLIVTANGGTGSYQYTLLQNGVPVGSPQSSSILNVFAGTNYSIMVSDANNCSGTSTPFTITQPPALGIAITNQTASGCSGPGTGSVTVIGTGGVAPYSYGFNGSATYSSTNTFVNLAAGGYTISVKDVNGCTASLSVTITGGSAPAVHNVIGGNSCNTNTGLTIGLDGADQGVTYVLLRDGNQIGVTFTSSLTGVGFTFSPAQTTPGTYTVVATSGGCQSTMNGSATLSAAPAVQNVSGGGTYCSGGVGLFIGLDNSETNVSYQLYMGNTKIGSPIPGTTGQQLSFGPEPLQGVYTIVATSAAGCTTLMNGTATINVSAAPSGYTLSAGLSNCSGNPIPLTLNGAQNGYKYQVYTSSNAAIGSAIVAQNDGTISMGSVLTGSYYVIGTAPAGCIGNPSNTVSVSAGSAPSIFTVGGDGGSYCTGGLGSVVTLSGSELGVTYELISNGNIVVDVNGTGNSISFGPQTAGVYTVTAINTTTACSASMSGSATISANSAKPTFSTQLSSPGTVCPGVTVTLSVQSPEAISYQWYYNNGAINGQTGSSLILSSVTVANAGSYYVVAIGSCGNTQSSVVQLGVNVAPSISSQPLQTQTVCSGSAVTFQVTASNSDGSTPTYQWYFGGTQITGATSSFYTIPSVSSGNQGVYYVIVSNACNLSTQSSTASLFVNTSPSVAAIGGGGSTVCVNGTIPAFTDATPGGHWSVLSGTGTASIDDNGVVTGLTAGTVTIQYSVTGCGTTTVTTGLTVLGAPVVNAIAGGTSVICVGSQTPAFTDATPGGIWSVINVSGSANINQNGVVTATGVGQVTVQYSVANSCSTTIVSATLNISSLTQPTFATIPAQCAGGVSPLPTISNESITGIWTPAFDPNNTKTYTFIPNSGQCASATTQITVTITSAVAPTFAAIPAQCAGGTSPLPTVSTNSITGTWTPPFDPNNTKTYTFIPNSGQCALSTTQVTVTITSAVTPTFAAIPAQCAGGTSPLPAKSTNNITGTWTPAFDPNNTKTYTFIPNSGQCASATTQIAVTITSAVAPTFAAIPAQCAGGTSPLPTVSTNSITGTWTPAFDPNNTKTYTFIPNSGQCALSTTQVTVTITSAVTPTFAAIPAQCAGGTSPLPAKSINNITGTWTPAFDPNNTKTYTFIPNSGQCALSTTQVTVTITTAVAPTFAAIPAQCAGGTSPLPAKSTNNITGTWTPAFDPNNTKTYTFIPNSGQCALSTTQVTVTITSAVTPTFAAIPAQCAGGTSPLPAKSTNNITGTWTPAFDPNNTKTYTFIPNSGQCALSTTQVTVTITQLGSISSQPTSQTECAGVSATFTVGAVNAAGYQWWNAGTNTKITGATNASYSTSTNGSYKVVVTGSCGNTVTSNTVTLSTTPSASITSQPVSQTNCGGGPVTFTVSASNASTYQWYRNNAVIGGARSASYTTSVAATYKVVITGTCGNQVTSNSVTLSASQPPSIVTQPTSQATCSGVSVTFSVTATNTTSYQWYRNGSPIGGATNPTYTTAVAGSYRVVVFGNCGSSATSNAAILTVNTVPNIAGISGGSTVCLGSTLHLSELTPGGTWSTSNGSIASISTSGVVTGVTTGSVTITYTVGGTCGTNSVSKTVTVMSIPNVAGIGGTSSVCVGSTITLTDATTGGSWSSSNPAVITVTSSGVVRGIARGSATITYSVSGNCGVGVATKGISVNCSGRGFADVGSNDSVMTKEEQVAEQPQGLFNVTVVPNPSQSFFTLVVQSDKTDVAAYIRIFDMAGRLVDEKRGAIGESIHFGGTYVQGMYVVQVMQGSNLKVIKVIKN